MRGVVWELFAGSAVWTAAMRADGWAALTPVDIVADARLDLLDWFFVEKVLLIAATGRNAVVHLGTPCSSMSAAITPAWRTAAYPLGAPGLQGSACKCDDRQHSH